MKTLNYYYIVCLLDFLASLAENRFATHGLGRALRQFRREVVIFKAHSKNYSNNRIGKKEFDKAQIGGGNHVLEGFLNIDAKPPADLVCDVREGIPLEDAALKLIFSEHFLEHIDYPASVKKFIAECYRVLKSGGQIILGVPDAEAIIRGYTENNINLFAEQVERWYGKRNCTEHINTYIDLVNYVFRDQDDDQNYTPHLWAYDYQKLENLLKNAGFSEIKSWEFDENIAKPKRKWGSIYVIATK